MLLWRPVNYKAKADKKEPKKAVQDLRHLMVLKGISDALNLF